MPSKSRAFNCNLQLCFFTFFLLWNNCHSFSLQIVNPRLHSWKCSESFLLFAQESLVIPVFCQSFRLCLPRVKIKRAAALLRCLLWFSFSPQILIYVVLSCDTNLGIDWWIKMERTLFSGLYGVILVLNYAFISSEDRIWSITSIFQKCSGLKLCYVFNKLTLSATFFFYFLQNCFFKCLSCFLLGLTLELFWLWDQKLR